MPLSDELQTEVLAPVSPEDPRWQVVERIVRSPCFQRSERLKAFLKYVTQQYLSDQVDRLTGPQIGRAVFGKTAEHDQSEDNTVRIYARQLRLRLLEYFDTYGRDEPYIVEIPKGSYVPVFRPAAHAPPENVVTAEHPIEAPATREFAEGKRAANWKAYLGWLAATVLAVALIVTIVSYRRPVVSGGDKEAARDLWPLAELGSSNEQTQIVLSDNSFALYQVASNHRFSLSDYLKSEYPRNVFSPPGVGDTGIRELIDQLGRKQITSYADAEITARISRLNLPGTWVTRPSRDIKLREVQEGNYVFLGSPYSNPWVELYEPRLNFVFSSGLPLGIINRHPRGGEPASYLAQGRTGTVGDDYAAIAVIPNEKRGVVMIIQGTKEEGTEAAGMFIADPAGRKLLRNKLNLQSTDSGPVFFEAVLQTKTFAGAPAETQVVTVRRIDIPAQ